MDRKVFLFLSCKLFPKFKIGFLLFLSGAMSDCPSITKCVLAYLGAGTKGMISNRVIGVFPKVRTKVNTGRGLFHVYSDQELVQQNVSTRLKPVRLLYLVTFIRILFRPNQLKSVEYNQFMLDFDDRIEFERKSETSHQCPK